MLFMCFCLKNKKRLLAVFYLIAEDEGFKPPIPKKSIPDFESSAFDHSANLPLEIQTLRF